MAKNPEMVGKLSVKERGFVERGQLTRGMSKDGVYLAWGAPEQRFEGYAEGGMTERWDYTTTKTVSAPQFSLGFGFGSYGRYRRGYSGLGFSTGPDFATVPVHAASVWFTDGRVKSWERVR